VPKPELVERCKLGAYRGPECAHDHVARALNKGIGGSRSLRLCPGHDGREATLSINAGDIFRVVWNEQAATCELDDLDIHSLLLAKGVDESCLGTYGLRKQASRERRDVRAQGIDPAAAADIGRWRAVQELPADLEGRLIIMCRQAIAEGDGSLPGDPLRLLPWIKPDFVALGQRAGLQRNYPYKLWDRWVLKLPSDAA
jgi:hypothetical protein